MPPTPICAIVIFSFAPILPGPAKTPDGIRYGTLAAAAPAAARNSRLLSLFDFFIDLLPFCFFGLIQSRVAASSEAWGWQSSKSNPTIPKSFGFEAATLCLIAV
jgi:hypothetical protein